jgi:hypothetical protein
VTVALSSSNWQGVVLAAIAALQVVLLSVIALLHERGLREQRKLNGHAAELLAARVIRERDAS